MGGYATTTGGIAPEGSWVDAPADAIIFGLKELPDDGTPLHHRHIMFGHAYKGQTSGRILLDRFQAGGGTLYDLEYLLDADGRRVAAFGYWAGYAGAAVSLLSFAAQQNGGLIGPVSTFANAPALVGAMQTALNRATPSTPIIGSLRPVGPADAPLLPHPTSLVLTSHLREIATR